MVKFPLRLKWLLHQVKQDSTNTIFVLFILISCGHPNIIQIFIVTLQVQYKLYIINLRKENGINSESLD